MRDLDSSDASQARHPLDHVSAQPPTRRNLVPARRGGKVADRAVAASVGLVVRSLLAAHLTRQ
ncbi:MAG TPA: hypothetical protein VFR16_10570 [Agromyces mariniharenae]|nr:hypothetical protein [Agromyces mariniharenae]